MFHIVIPARYASARLPGKPLAMLAGKPLIQWVWERVQGCGAASVIIATDDARIRDAARAFGADCEMTLATHASGSDRVAEVAELRGFRADEIVVNVQGDEPLLAAGLVADLAAALQSRPATAIATPVCPLGSIEEFLDPNCVKALRALDGHALYFSRAPVPWPRDHVTDGRPGAFPGAWRHIGIYAYRAGGLRQFATAPPSPLERTEMLEQLRALEHGLRIFLLPVAAAPPPGVDTPADLERVRAQLAGTG